MNQTKQLSIPLLAEVLGWEMQVLKQLKYDNKIDVQELVGILTSDLLTERQKRDKVYQLEINGKQVSNLTECDNKDLDTLDWIWERYQGDYRHPELSREKVFETMRELKELELSQVNYNENGLVGMVLG